MEFASEMVVKARLSRQKISEVPVVLHPDGRDRPPHLRSFRDGWRHLRFLLLMCPLWLYLIPAFLLLGGGLGLMLWLTPGPRRLGNSEFDVRALLIGAVGVGLGFQTLWLWLYARVHGGTTGLLPADRFTLWIERGLTPERGLLAGSVLLLTGLGLNLWGWGEPQSDLRLSVWGWTILVLGVQTLQGCFLLRAFRLGSETQGRQGGIPQ
jgi:hypothetical protein